MIGATNRRTKGDNLQHRQHRQRQQLAKKEERDKQLRGELKDAADKHRALEAAAEVELRILGQE